MAEKVAGLDRPEDQRRFYAVNAAGAALWLSIADGLQPAEVIGDLACAAPVADRERVEEGVWDLLVAWAQSGLLAGFEHTWAEKACANGSFTVSGTLRGSVLVVPLAHTYGEKMEQIELPAQDVRRLVLVEPGQESRARLAIGHPAATLDALIVAAGDANRLDSARAASLAAWLNGLEVFEIEVGVDGEQEATQLLDLVSDPSLIKKSEWA